MEIIFICPYFKKSNNGEKCDAALCIAENDLIKNIPDADLRFCINRHRRYESCYIYSMKLKMEAISQLHISISSLDARSHTYNL